MCLGLRVPGICGLAELGPLLPPWQARRQPSPLLAQLSTTLSLHPTSLLPEFIWLPNHTPRKSVKRRAAKSHCKDCGCRPESGASPPPRQPPGPPFPGGQLSGFPVQA